MEFSDTRLEIGTFIRHVTWKHLYPIENLRRLMQSRKQVVVFLDENDSDFGAYVVEALRTNIDVLSYYAFFHHMKQRQHLLSQTLMSLLFLEAINIRTRKPFAEEVMVVSQPSRRLVKKFRISGRLGDVFEAFLLGSAVRRQISAKFLKCMKCDGSELKKIGMYKDLSDSRNLGLFFSDLIKCFKENECSGKESDKSIIACFCNVPISDLSIASLRESGLEKIFSTAKQPIMRFWLTSQGDLGGSGYQSLTETEDEMTPLIEFERIPFLYTGRSKSNSSRGVQPLDLVVLSRHIIRELDEHEIILEMRITDLISDSILKEFLEILLSSTDRELTVSKFSVDLASLLELGLQKYPKVLNSEDIKVLFATSSN